MWLLCELFSSIDISGNDFLRFTLLLPGASFDLFTERRTNVRWAGRAEVYTRRLGATATASASATLHSRRVVCQRTSASARSSYLLVSEL